MDDCPLGEESAGHAGHLDWLARHIALGMGVGAARAERIGLASRSHDIGKRFIPRSIVLKTGPLTPGEQLIMREHPVLGARYLRSLGAQVSRGAEAIQAAWFHHEHWDGLGYPIGLAGEQIPLAARIVAVADVFDALVSRRPYKQAWSFDEARQYLCDRRARQFDPHCVDLCIELIDGPAYRQRQLGRGNVVECAAVHRPAVQTQRLAVDLVC